MLVYDVKLPGRIEPYEIPPRSIRRNDHVAFVCDSLLPRDVDGVAIRHYSFPDRWWSANISIDIDGALRTEFAGYTFDCDITTPHFEAFGALCNIDLKLDVFLKEDGRQHVVTDQDHFQGAIDAGWIDDFDRSGAKNGLAELLNIIETDGLASFLEKICPLHPLTDASEIGILPHRNVDDVPVLEYWRSIRLGGK